MKFTFKDGVKSYVCAQCGDEFVPVGNQKYCSDKCRALVGFDFYEAFKPGQFQFNGIGHCKRCKKKMLLYPARKDVVFCSRRCRRGAGQ